MTEALPMSVDSLLAETDWLRALCQQLVRDTDRADDLFQDTVLAGIRDGAQRRGALRPWLASVARNLVANQRRAAQRAEARERARARDAEEPSTFDAVARVGAQRRVLEAVEHLPAEQCEVVLLRYLEDLPPRQIAARLDLNVDTVKTRLKRGLATLRERLDAEYGSRAEWAALLVPLASGVGLVPAGSTVGKVTAGAGAVWAGSKLLRATAVLVVSLGVFGGVMAWAPWQQAAAPSTPRGRVADAAGVADAAEASEAAAAPRSETRDPVASVPEPVAEPVGDQLRLVVRGGADGSPAAGVDVYLEILTVETPPDPRESERQKAVEAGRISVLDVMRDVADHFVTSDAGEILVPWPGDPQARVSVFAESETEEAMVQVLASEVEQEDDAHWRIEIDLQPQAWVDVQVVDAAGARLADQSFGFRLGGQIWNGARTGADGSARLRLPALPEEYLPMGGLQVLVPGGDAELRTVAAEELRGDPIELVAPATGSLEVVAVDAEGRRVTVSGTASLSVVPADAVARVEASGLPVQVAFERIAEIEAEGGVARLERVALQQRYSASLRVPGYLGSWRSEVVDGPRSPGRSVSLEVRAPHGDGFGALRILGVDGRPLAGAEIDVIHGWVVEGGVLQQDTGSSSVADADGVIRGRVIRRGEPERAGEILEIRQRSAEGRPVVGARVALPLADESGLPVDCVLQPMPCLAAGRIVDGSGQPLANVEVRVEFDDVGRQRTYELGRVRTEAGTGRFTVFGFGDPDRLRIVAERHDLGELVQDVAPGRRDHVLVFVEGRTVTGGVDSGGGESDFSIRLVPEGGEAEQAPETHGSPEGYTFPRIPPGRYELQVSLLDIGIVARRFVEVPEGPADEPVVLEPLDVRSGFRRVTVTALDPQGQPVPGLWFGMAFGRSVRNQPTDAAGRVTVLIPMEGATLRVDDPAWQPIERKDVLEDQVLRLQPRR